MMGFLPIEIHFFPSFSCGSKRILSPIRTYNSIYELLYNYASRNYITDIRIHSFLKVLPNTSKSQNSAFSHLGISDFCILTLEVLLGGGMLTMDKEWLHLPRFSSEYQDGARKFIDMAQANARNPERFSCPCINCKNLRYQRSDVVYEHLVIKGMDPTYITWVFHGEKCSASAKCESTPSQSTGRESKNKGKAKVGRGPTKLKSGGPQEEIITNDRYDPVGPNSSKYASQIGVLVREHIPASLGNWRKIPQELKENVWELVKQKYKVKTNDKVKGLQMMGKLRRDNKCRLTSKIKKFHENEKDNDSEERDINDLKPAYMDDKDWETFLSQRESQEFKERSLKFQEIRKKQKFVHRSSRKGFARLEYELKNKTEDLSKITRVDVWTHGYTKGGKTDNPAVADVIQRMEEYAQTPEGQAQTGIHDDAIAHVFGPERPGRVRGLGSGATPSMVHASIGASISNKAIMDELKDLRQQLSGMSKLKKEVKEMKEIMAVMASQRKKSSGSQESPASVGLSQQSGTGRRGNKILENAKCTLLSWTEDGGEVAKGTIVSTDPKVLVHHVPLGRDCCKVWVNDVFVLNVPLFRPMCDMYTLDDAFRSTIVWPIYAIRFDD